MSLLKSATSDDKAKFDWLVSFMVLNDPFSHSILMLMDKTPTTEIKTMGIVVKEHGITLRYNPEYFRNLSMEEARYVFQHEVFHVALHHCTRRMPSDPGEMKIFNLACDLAVNSLIQENSGVKAPKGVIHPSKLKIEVGLSVEQYMDILRNMDFPKPQPQKGKGDEDGDKEEDEDGEGGSEGEGDEDGEGGSEGEPRDGVPDTFDDHSQWAESEIVEQTIRDTIETIKNTNKWGSISGDVQAVIEAAQRSQVNWRGLLRKYLGQIPSVSHIPTYKRPNRRFGYPYSGKKREHIDKALFAIDTSGSISDENLSQFLAELNKFVDQYPADLVLFDTTITYGPKPFSKKNNKFTFTGRGGTCVDDVLEMALERKYNSVVFLTDGYFPQPPDPGNLDVVWVITEGGTRPVPWGKYVQLVHKDPKKK